jgi:hypothetical protein
LRQQCAKTNTSVADGGAVLMTAVLVVAAVTWLVAAATINAAFAAP